MFRYLGAQPITSCPDYASLGYSPHPHGQGGEVPPAPCLCFFPSRPQGRQCEWSCRFALRQTPLPPGAVRTDECSEGLHALSAPLPVRSHGAACRRRGLDAQGCTARAVRLRSDSPVTSSARATITRADRPGPRRPPIAGRLGPPKDVRLGAKQPDETTHCGGTVGSSTPGRTRRPSPPPPRSQDSPSYPGPETPRRPPQISRGSWDPHTGPRLSAALGPLTRRTRREARHRHMLTVCPAGVSGWGVWGRRLSPGGREGPARSQDRLERNPDKKSEETTLGSGTRGGKKASVNFSPGLRGRKPYQKF